MYDLVTHCLTIGRRPDLLQTTLSSLGPLTNLTTLAINDFGDQETNDVLLTSCPNGRIVGPGTHLGHHPAVDDLYSHVTTPYVFHNEDDWGFSRHNFLDDALRLLEADPRISVVCLRASGDIPLPAKDRPLIRVEERSGVRFERLDGLHRRWHGYTFNPHLARIATWQQLGGFSQFTKESHISQHMLHQGKFVAFLLPSACRHIGDDRSTHHAGYTRFQRLKRWYRAVGQVPE